MVSARYFFDLHDGTEIIVDEDGVRAASAADAIQEALVIIEEMRARGEIDFDRDWDLVIRDADGATVKRLPIR